MIVSCILVNEVSLSDVRGCVASYMQAYMHTVLQLRIIHWDIQVQSCTECLSFVGQWTDDKDALCKRRQATSARDLLGGHKHLQWTTCTSEGRLSRCWNPQQGPSAASRQHKKLGRQLECLARFEQSCLYVKPEAMWQICYVAVCVHCLTIL